MASSFPLAQTYDLAVCRDAIHQSLHQVCILRGTDPTGQFTVRNDDEAACLIKERYCPIEYRQILRCDVGVHHVVDDDY